jgi:DNA polymerase-3 subunit delta'
MPLFMNSVNDYGSFSRIIGQERAVQFLSRVISGEKIPHAYLFTGISGVGKTTTAIAFTQAINCLQPAGSEGCGRCKPCRQVIGGTFPDLVYIQPDGQNIKIEQIRDLNRGLNFKPVSGKYRVTIIQQAEMMTEEAANSFLKALEEPPQGNVFILKTIEPLDLLPTIVSRCQKIPFRPLPLRLIETWLINERGIEEERASLIARVSEGSLGRAIHIAETGFLEDRQNHIMKMIGLPALSKVQALEMALEYIGKKKKRSQDNLPGDADLFEVMGMWKTWYRDLILMKVNGPPDLLINIDFSRKLINLSKRFNIENLIESFLLVDQTQRDLMKNPNIGLMMEDMVLRLKGLCGTYAIS